MALDFTDYVEGIFDNIDDLILDPQKRAEAYASYLSYVGYDATSASVVSCIDDITASYFRKMAIIRMTDAASLIDFVSITDAQDFLSIVRPIYEAEIAYCLDQSDADNADLFTTLRTSVVNSIMSTDTDLPYLMTYTTTRSLPACVVGQMYYQDGSRDTEIILRNVPIHPAFLDTSIEILSF